MTRMPVVGTISDVRVAVAGGMSRRNVVGNGFPKKFIAELSEWNDVARRIRQN